MVNYKIGVMQGRLLPKYKGRYQAHPVGYWWDEFPIAARLGLDLIEFIFDYDEYFENPLLSVPGIKKILNAISETGVAVESICADYFMTAPLHSEDRGVQKRSVGFLEELLVSAQQIGVHSIIIPCVDNGSLDTRDKIDRLIWAIGEVYASARATGVKIAIESDLPPGELVQLLRDLGSADVKVNYDVGNSASLGYDPEDELRTYGDRISVMHIKDRLLGGGPIELGHGSVDWERFLTALNGTQFRGPFIMQAYRDDEGIGIFSRQLKWFKDMLDNLFRDGNIYGNNSHNSGQSRF